jgi:hypothetical protein
MGWLSLREIGQKIASVFGRRETETEIPASEIHQRLGAGRMADSSFDAPPVSPNFSIPPYQPVEPGKNEEPLPLSKDAMIGERNPEALQGDGEDLAGEHTVSKTPFQAVEARKNEIVAPPPPTIRVISQATAGPVRAEEPLPGGHQTETESIESIAANEDPANEHLEVIERALLSNQRSSPTPAGSGTDIDQLLFSIEGKLDAVLRREREKAYARRGGPLVPRLRVGELVFQLGLREAVNVAMAFSKTNILERVSLSQRELVIVRKARERTWVT